MNCPLCTNQKKNHQLIIDEKNMWLVCNSGDHKYKLTTMSDTTRKSITRKVLSDTIVALRNGLGQEGIDIQNQDLLNGQIHAYQMLADYLSDDDWRDFLPE
jgi:hypothetical protein